MFGVWFLLLLCDVCRVVFGVVWWFLLWLSGVWPVVVVLCSEWCVLCGMVWCLVQCSVCSQCGICSAWLWLRGYLMWFSGLWLSSDVGLW